MQIPKRNSSNHNTKDIPLFQPIPEKVLAAERYLKKHFTTLWFKIQRFRNIGITLSHVDYHHKILFHCERNKLDIKNDFWRNKLFAFLSITQVPDDDVVLPKQCSKFKFEDKTPYRFVSSGKKAKAQ